MTFNRSDYIEVFKLAQKIEDLTFKKDGNTEIRDLTAKIKDLVQQVIGQYQG